MEDGEDLSEVFPLSPLEIEFNGIVVVNNSGVFGEMLFMNRLRRLFFVDYVDFGFSLHC